MKKFFAIVFALVMLLAVVSCNKAVDVTMSFDTDGGSAVAAITAKAGEKITKPADPTKDGLTFGGWYADIDLTEAYVFPEVMPSADLTVYAKWNVTLTFDSKGGSAVDPIVGKGGSVFNLPAAPTRDGYVFVGWYTDTEWKNKLTYVMPKSNTTAYARWQVFEVGSAINVGNEFLVNDAGTYTKEVVDGGVKYTATAEKGEWAFIYAIINGNAKENCTLVAELQGTKDVTAVIKLEGGNAEANIEQTITFTGEPQRIEWTVEAKNLTSIGGQKFLIFLNGGTAGCNETAPEYVIVKSVALYRTVEADAPQRSVLFFMPNGGSEVASYYLEPGTAITAPEEPTKEGYIFTGWYADAELTVPYTFDVMPRTATTVYAGWKLASTYLEDCNLLGGTMTALDADHYEVTNEENRYTIKKTAVAGEWTFLVLPMTGKKLAGYNLLRVEIKGTAGQQIMFKINDSNAGERTITMNGQVQTFELTFDFDLDPNKSLVICALPGVAGESGVFEITGLAWGNYSKYVNLLVEGWRGLDEGVYDIQFNNSLNIKKNPGEGIDWSCCVLKLEDVKLTGFDALKVVVKGTAGEQILFKINDNGGACEKWVTCDGTVQEFLFDFEHEFDMTKQTLVIFGNAGANGTGNVFEIYELAYVMTKAPVEPEPDPDPVEAADDIDLMNEEIKPLDEGAYEVVKEDGLVIIKKTTGGEWSCAVIDMTGKEVNGLCVLQVTVQGPANKKIMFKINDSVEKWVTCNGLVQELEFTFDVELDPAKKLVIFAEAGEVGTGAEFKLTKLAYASETTLYNVNLKGFTPNGGCDIAIETTDTALTFTKGSAAGEWDCIVFKDEKANVKGCNAVRVLFVGDKDQTIMFKINDTVEYWITCTGAEQTLVLPYTIEIDTKKNLMVIFPDAGKPTSGHSFSIGEITFINAPTEVDLLKAEFKGLDEGAYVVIPVAEGFEIGKLAGAGEWSCATTPTPADLAGKKVVSFKVTVKGAAGEQIMFKINDKVEKWVTCDGTVQTLTFDVEVEIEAGKPLLVIFANAGTASTGNVFDITELKLLVK